MSTNFILNKSICLIILLLNLLKIN
jgi:hypothetical protein